MAAFYTVIVYFAAFLPVLLFLAMLVWLDSFALVNKRCLTGAFLWGVVSTAIAAYGSEGMAHLLRERLFVAPVFEELLKGLGVLYLIERQRAAFFIDAVLYGVAVGAGFAVAENILYIWTFADMTLGTAVMRGIGTAIMHCGAVAGTAAILSWFSLRSKRGVLRYYLIALLPAIALHSLYNSLILPPALALIAVLFGVAAWIIALIICNEKTIGKWLDVEVDTEVQLLTAMQKGEFTQSRAGVYLLSLREHFAAETFVDMYCYLKLYLELSLASKRNMMLAEAGIDIPEEDDLARKLTEFNALKRQIGKTGEIALAPLVKRDRLFEWKVSKL
ncbi:MAG: PrsW family intramembrane metalloprotease [Tannerellaceae bacterium]|jgi:RsiW-degrading membrane proteinase PrsW (M82 family)|nr:PrsW family intramembrane metalloprotease [Tannerellaceae bacterium]